MEESKPKDPSRSRQDGERQVVLDWATEGSGTTIARYWSAAAGTWSYTIESSGSLDDEQASSDEDLTGGPYPSFAACWAAEREGTDFAAAHPLTLHPDIQDFMLTATLRALDRALQRRLQGLDDTPVKVVEAHHRRWLEACGYARRMQPLRPGMLRVDSGVPSHKDAPLVGSVDISVRRMTTVQDLLDTIYTRVLVSETRTPMVARGSYGDDWYLLHWRTHDPLRPSKAHRFLVSLASMDLRAGDILQLRYGPLPPLH